MLDSHVDGYNVVGQSEAPTREVLPSNVPKVKPISVDVQTQKSDVERCTASILQESYEADYSLPDVPLKSLMTHMDIMGRLREQGKVRNFLGFESSSQLERVAEDDACPVPYFIPELEMYCAREEAGHLKELNLATVEETKVLEMEVLETMETCPSQEEEISFHKIEEEIEVAEIKDALSFEFEDINLTNLEVSQAPEMEESSGVENTPEPLVTIPVIEEPISPITIVQEPIRIEEPTSKPLPSRGIGFINSLIGLKPIWRPSVGHCFGDREWKKIQHNEEIKQQTCRALKSLILCINLFKKLKELSQETQPKQLERSKGTLTYSKIFKQNIFQNHHGELSENALAGGEPVQRNPLVNPERIRLFYKLDASDGWSRNAPDWDSSGSCDSEDSGIKTNLSVTNNYSREIMNIHHPMADRQDIESSGRILFSKPVTLFRFSSVQQAGNLPGPNKHPYSGDIKILERHGLYYILLHEKDSSFLLVYTRIDGNWHIGYKANRTNSCGWFNFNYAFCSEGTPEHFVCTFQEPSHAAEFVARVRNLVIKARFLNLPRF
ncbi:uncharacterized protein Sprn isoform X2 [Drosophila kikkawai]|uniref:Uncharacterized protein Sprn isoform X2 n=1 Tax=Drosophila kikkawai TaxID=30033 RepID=A0ABM4GH18_DROKI